MLSIVCFLHQPLPTLTGIVWQRALVVDALNWALLRGCSLACALHSAGRGGGGGGGLLGHSVVLWADVESSSSEPPGARTVIERMLWVLIAFLPAFAPDIMHDESVLLGTAGVD